MSLAALLAGMREGDDFDQNESPPAMATELLVEHGKRYAAFLDGCAFKAGDLVTPRKDSDIKGAGEPHIVLETREAAPHFIDKVGSNTNGTRQDMRVAGFVGPRIISHWAESYQWEPFTAS